LSRFAFWFLAKPSGKLQRFRGDFLQKAPFPLALFAV
jgi:hypothetical protein